MEMEEYYFLGLEAKTRENNKYLDLDDAIQVAAYVCKKTKTPVRIFRMLKNNKAILAKTMTFDEALSIVEQPSALKVLQNN